MIIRIEIPHRRKITAWSFLSSGAVRRLDSRLTCLSMGLKANKSFFNYRTFSYLLGLNKNFVNALRKTIITSELFVSKRYS